jgi:hypothetical protein
MLSGYSSGILPSMGPHQAKQRRFKSARLVGEEEIFFLLMIGSVLIHMSRYGNSWLGDP